MINGIKSSSGDDWLRRKFLERQAQQSIQISTQQQNSNSTQNTQPPEQINGTKQVQNANKISSPPWADFMQSIGLSPQGSNAADISAIGAKITQMKAQATDPAQKAQIDSLEKQYDGYKAVAANMPAQTQPQQNQFSSTPPEQMVGATQLGVYNQMLVKKRQPEESY